VVVLSFATRYLRLWNPAGVAFDESHFGGFNENYLQGKYFFDIHPPLGKLTFAALGWVLGYRDGHCDFSNIGVPYDPENCKYYILRSISAVFGSMLIPLVFSIARKFGCTNKGAVLAACLVNFDMLNLTESRLILMDAQLMFYSALSLWIALKFWKAFDPEPEAGKPAPVPLTDFQFLAWAAALGISCGLAISVKWTAMVTPAMIALESTLGIWFLRRRRFPFVGLLQVLFFAICTYTFVFAVHFWTLSHTGDRESAFVPVEFSEDYQKTLIGHPEFHEQRSAPAFWWKFPMANAEMFIVNKAITEPHHWGSRYNQWVVNSRGLAYWGDDGKYEQESEYGVSRQVYLLGNPLVVWGTSICILLWLLTSALALHFRYVVDFRPKDVRGLQLCGFAFVAWICNLAPYVLVERSCFIYHYMPGLLYVEILAALWLDRVSFSLRKYTIGLALAAVVTSFLYFSPWVYALPLSNEAIADRRWMPGWD